MRVDFSDAFLTGHPDIDGEHIEIFEIINAVADAIDEREFSNCHKLTSSFLELCRDHFQHEEEILAKLKFPRLEEHASFHTALLEKGETIFELCECQSDPSLLEDRFTELVTFFIEEVVRGDLDFVSFLQDKGVVPIRSHSSVSPVT
jgi:hemerythrin